MQRNRLVRTGDAQNKRGFVLFELVLLVIYLGVLAALRAAGIKPGTFLIGLLIGLAVLLAVAGLTLRGLGELAAGSANYKGHAPRLKAIGYFCNAGAIGVTVTVALTSALFPQQFRSFVRQFTG